MEYRSLGTSGLKVSALGLGNWLTHANQVGNEAAKRCVDAALEHGINVFDTADSYAERRAEEVLGQCLRGVRRESLVLGTKVYFPTGSGPNDRGLSRKHILESCRLSLEALKTDYIDLYQAHRFDHQTPVEETMRAFAYLVQNGHVLYVGVSEWTGEQLEIGAQIAENLGVPLVSNQVEYSALWRVPERDVIDRSQSFGLSIIAFSPLAQGVLTGRYSKTHEARSMSGRMSTQAGRRMISRWMRDDVVGAARRLREVAIDLGVTPAQLALAWVLSKESVACALMGASSPQQIEENVGALQVDLDPGVAHSIDEALIGAIVRDQESPRSPVERP